MPSGVFDFLNRQKLCRPSEGDKKKNLHLGIGLEGYLALTYFENEYCEKCLLETNICFQGLEVMQIHS